MGHLQKVGETYSEHFKFASRLSLLLFKAAFAVLIHAIVPTILVTTASDAIKEVNDLLSERNAESDDIEEPELFI